MGSSLLLGPPEAFSGQRERRQLDLAFPGARLGSPGELKKALRAGEDVAILRSHLTQRAATPQGFLRPIIAVLAPDLPLGIPAPPRLADSGTRTSPWKPDTFDVSG